MPRPHSPLYRAARRPSGTLAIPSRLTPRCATTLCKPSPGSSETQFANAVFALKPGAWHGPIASSFGLHLVRVTEAKPARQLAFSEVEPQVRERWRDEHQREANEQYYESLLKKYGVVVDESVKPLIGPLDGFAALANKTVAQQPEVRAGASIEVSLSIRPVASLLAATDVGGAGHSIFLRLGLR